MRGGVSFVLSCFSPGGGAAGGEASSAGYGREEEKRLYLCMQYEKIKNQNGIPAQLFGLV
jgi:hypothetical protein